MKRITKKKDLPSWFALENYQVFKSMTDIELVEQIAARRDMYELELKSYIKVKQSDDFLDMTSEEREDFSPENQDICYSQIVNSKPDLREVIYSFLKHSEITPTAEPYTLEGVYGVAPLTFSQVIGLKEDYISAGLEAGYVPPDRKNIDHNKQAQSIDYWREVNGEKYWFMPEKGLNININLRDLTDTQILRDLKSLLPLWRNKIVKPEPKGLKPIVTDYQNMKDYEVFAYFDLLVWAELNGFKITDHLMANSIYEYGKYTEKSAEWGENHIKHTLKKLYKKVFSLRYKPYKSR
jgi:hypothetical protein